MNIEFSADDEAFRAEVRAFLAASLTPDMRRESERTTTVFADKDLAMKWQEILVDKGWAVPAWPEQHGGTNWTPNQKYIWGQECAKAHAPGLIPLGMRMLAPVLFKYGTPEQKAEYLPKILSGEHYWCQGYSEPGSGSDLSSLKTSAVKDGDDYIVNGTKIWTTHAQFADHIFCLVRTDADVKPQAGITFLLIPMNLPGIKVDPIITMADDHEVNQVFFDDVRVPQSNRVGPENEGWTVAKYLLEFERGGGGSAPGIYEALKGLKEVARREVDGGHPLMDDPSFASRIAELEIRTEALQLQELMTLERISSGGSPGPGSSLAKNTSVEINQGLSELRLEAVHYYGLPNANKISLNGFDEAWVGAEHSETAMARYLNGRAASVFGGSREVQKNIIAKVVLGL